MKKLSLLVLLLCACLLLSACKATDPDNLFEMPLDQEETSQTEPKEFKNYVGTHPYGNIQAGGNYLLLDNEVLFFYLDNGKARLFAYDLNTEEVRFYCDDATCSHSSCVSEAIASDLTIHEGKVYGLMLSEDYLSWCPAVVNGNQAEPLIEANTGGFFHYEDMLYMLTKDGLLVKWKEGEEPQLVMEIAGFPSGFVTCGEYLYYGDLGAELFYRVKLTEEQPQAEVLIENAFSGMIDGKHIYYCDPENGFLYRCDLDGSNPECLLQQKIRDYNFDEEYVYFNLSTGAVHHDPGNEDSYTVYRMQKDDPAQIEKVAVLPDLVGYIYTVPGTGTLFVENWRRNDIKAQVYMVNIDGTGMQVLDIPAP